MQKGSFHDFFLLHNNLVCIVADKILTFKSWQLWPLLLSTRCGLFFTSTYRLTFLWLNQVLMCSVLLSGSQHAFISSKSLTAHDRTSDNQGSDVILSTFREWDQCTKHHHQQCRNDYSYYAAASLSCYMW